MRRQTNEDITSRVYSYGCVPERIAPIRGAKEQQNQLRLANRLWNTLVAIERARVARYRGIMRDGVQDRIEQLRETMGAARDSIKARRATERKRGAPGPEMQVIAEARAELGRLIEYQRENAKERHDAKRERLDDMNAKTKHRVKRARQAAARMGLFWGTYNDVIQRFDAARKHGGEIHFRRYDGNGTLTAQIIGGTLAARCVDGDHTFFQIETPSESKYAPARMRIGSTEDREPVWLEVPAVYHRPIPAHASIRSVSITRRHGKHQLNVTVNLPKPQQRTGARAIAVDIGWRLMPEGDQRAVRVAYWADTDGRHGEVRVCAYDIAQFERLRSLRSTCDLMRDEALPPIAEWFGGRELPPGFPDVATIAQWRSGDRLAAMIREWADHRLPDDEEIFSFAAARRKQYLHVSRRWRNSSENMRARVREQYRLFAAQAAREYDAVYVEDFDLREVAERPEPESDEVSTGSSGYRQIVGPSVLRGALMNAAKREGLRVLKLPAEYTTLTCHVCGHSGAWDQAGSVMHRCEKCATTWDQDRNAAVNLLRLGLASDGTTRRGNQPVRPPISGDSKDRSQSGPEVVDAAAVVA